MNKLSCFIGYDSKEDIAYRVCKYSLNKRSSLKTNIISSNQAIIWDSLRLSNTNEKINGFGQLFKSH